MFALVSMWRITRVEISYKEKMCKRNSNLENFENTLSLIYTLCAMLEMMIETMFAIVSMIRLNGAEISNMPKCAKQTAISKSFKTL